MQEELQTTVVPDVLLEVLDKYHEPHVVLTLALSARGLDVEPSEAAKAAIEADLRQGREEARHLPVIGWLLEKAMMFAEHRMADYFGMHELRRVQMRFDGTQLSVHVGRAVLDLGPGEVDPQEAQRFYEVFLALKQPQKR